MVNETNGPSQRKTDDELAGNPWAIIGTGRIPWIMPFLVAGLTGIIARFVQWREGPSIDPDFERWFTPGVAALAFLVGAGVCVVDRVVLRWGDTLRRHRINGHLIMTFFLGAVFLLFLYGLVQLEIIPGTFQFYGSFAAWRGRPWGDELYAVVFGSFLLLVSILGVVHYLPKVPVPGRGTAIVLLIIYLGGFAMLIMPNFKIPRGKREPNSLPFLVVLLWPFVVLLFEPLLMFPCLLVGAFIFGGEWVGSRLGHPYLGAFTAFFTLLAIVAVGVALSSRRRPSKPLP